MSTGTWPLPMLLHASSRLGSLALPSSGGTPSPSSHPDEPKWDMDTTCQLPLGTASRQVSAAGPDGPGQCPSVPWGWQLLPRCPLTSAEAGRKPNPVGMFLSSSQPLTPGLKCSSTWKRSSEEGSCECMSQAIGEEPNTVNPTISTGKGTTPLCWPARIPGPFFGGKATSTNRMAPGLSHPKGQPWSAHSWGILTVTILGQQPQRSITGV